MNLSLRLATRIDNLVSRRVTTDHVLGLPPRLHTCLQSCMALDSKVRKAQSMGLAAAERAVHKQLMISVDRLKRQAENSLLNPPEPVKSMGVKDIYADIKAVEEEFGGYKWDHVTERLSVTTESINLLDISLGRFKINLKLPHFATPTDSDGGVYVEALTPNCSCGHSHPHVSEAGYVCLGDGVHSVRKALAEGRVLDYFIILKQLLNSYDAEGSYTRLEHWGEEDDDRICCSDCGYDTTDYFYCDSCDCSYCDECYGSCEGCDELICDTCRMACTDCSTGLCPGCNMTGCKDCSNPLCETCSSKESCEDCNGRLCNSCVQACRNCGTSYCKSCADSKIGDCECGKPGQCSGCRENCDFCEVRQSGENDLGQAKDQQEFKPEEEVFGAPVPGFLPEPAVQEEDAEKCEAATA